MAQNLTEKYDAHFVFVVKIFITTANILAILSVIVNFTVIIVFLHIIQCHKYTAPNLMFSIQAIADTVVTLGMTLKSIVLNVKVVEASNLSNVFFMTMVFIDEYSIYLVITTLLFITVERFVLIKFPLQYHTHITKHKILLSIFFMAIINSVPGVAYVAYQPTTFQKWLSLGTDYYLAHGVISLVVLMVVFSLIAVIYKEIKKSIELRCQHHNKTTNTKKERKRRTIYSEKRKHLRVIFIMFSGIYTITFIPFMVTSVLTKFQTLSVETRSVRLLVYYSTVLINPLITLLFKEDYRHIVMKILRCDTATVAKKKDDMNRHFRSRNQVQTTEARTNLTLTS